jgi:hypothetical protein
VYVRIRIVFIPSEKESLNWLLLKGVQKENEFCKVLLCVNVILFSEIKCYVLTSSFVVRNNPSSNILLRGQIFPSIEAYRTKLYTITKVRMLNSAAIVSRYCFDLAISF